MGRTSLAGALGCGLATLATFPVMGLAGSARDYLNAPIDTWLTFYNFGYSTLVTPEDGADVTSSVTSNVLSQSIVVTRTMDYWGRTGGISVIFPYRYLNASSDAFRASNQGISDVAFLWQMNIFGGPALTKEQFRSFVPQTFSSFHLFVATPLGKYDATNPLNPSANRWTFFPTVNYSYTRLTRVGHGLKPIFRPRCSRPIRTTVSAAPRVLPRSRCSSSMYTRAAIDDRLRKNVRGDTRRHVRAILGRHYVE
jgi:hypothetical protein